MLVVSQEDHEQTEEHCPHFTVKQLLALALHLSFVFGYELKHIVLGEGAWVKDACEGGLYVIEEGGREGRELDHVWDVDVAVVQVHLHHVHLEGVCVCVCV